MANKVKKHPFFRLYFVLWAVIVSNRYLLRFIRQILHGQQNIYIYTFQLSLRWYIMHVIEIREFIHMKCYHPEWNMQKSERKNVENYESRLQSPIIFPFSNINIFYNMNEVFLPIRFNQEQIYGVNESFACLHKCVQCV